MSHIYERPKKFLASRTFSGIENSLDEITISLLFGHFSRSNFPAASSCIILGLTSTIHDFISFLFGCWIGIWIAVEMTFWKRHEVLIIVTVLKISICLKPILIGCKSHPMRDLGITLAPHFPVVRLAVVDPIKLATGSIEQPPPQISWNRRWSYTLRAPMAFPVESKTGSHRNLDFNWLPVSQSIHALWWEGRL